MASIPISGAAVVVNYSWESTFGSSSVTTPKSFGQGVKLTAYDMDNSAEFVYALGNQNAQKSVVKEFKGTFGLEFILSDPWWLRLILGGTPTDAGATPYTHTWTVANSGIINTLPSATLDVNYDMTVDASYKVLGAQVGSATISANVGDTIKVKLDGTFINLTLGTTLSAAAAPVEEPFTFAQGSLDFPSATTMTNVQSFELSINRNLELIWGLGSRFATKNVAKQREYNLKVTQTYEQSTDYVSSFLGSSTAPTATVAEVATCVFTVDNGGATSAMRKYVFTFADCLVEKVSIPASVEDITKQEISIRARNLTSVVVSNNTATAL